MTLALLAASVGLLSSCNISPAWFRPNERTLTESMTGFVAAEYQLHDGTDLGEVRVWSTGAHFDEALGDEGRTQLGITFEIENNSDTPLTLDPGELEIREVKAFQGPVEPLRPDAADALVVPPRSIGEQKFVFTFPEFLEPGDLDAFRLSWTVGGPQDKYFNQFTGFVRSGYRGHTSTRRAYWRPHFSIGFGVIHDHWD